jgi:hypothetical protein
MRGDAMKRFRLSTLMLVIVIAALSIALAVQERRAARREVKLQAEIADLRARLLPTWKSVFLAPQIQRAVMRTREDSERDLIKQLNRQLSGQ